MNRCLALLVLLFGLALPLDAQRVSIDSVVVSDTTQRHLLRLRDGSSITGRIIVVTVDSVRVRTDAGEMSLGRGAIQEVRVVGAGRFRNGEYWFENPHATRLLFSSTAFPLERGSGYYSNTLLAFHAVAAGVTDRLTLGAGVAWFPGIDLDETFYYLLPKYTVINGEQNKLAVGALVGLLPFGGFDDASTAGLLYAVGTTGSRDSNLSAGLGWGYIGDELERDPVVMIGGQHRFGRRLSFISENWIFPVGGGFTGVYSYGLRFLGEGLTADLAYVSLFRGNTGGIPWLGFSFKF
jgi:hypothetical protein